MVKLAAPTFISNNATSIGLLFMAAYLVPFYDDPHLETPFPSKVHLLRANAN